MFAEMENARCQHGVGLAFQKDVGHVLEASRPTTRDDGNRDGLANATGDDQIEPGFRAVGVDAVKNDFSGTQRNCASGPLDRFEAGGVSAAV
jgi:hypothetical protein